ncbi:MAG: hypothetical protein RBR75_00295 [Acholeplasmataceae bacterium]|jgi:hypothetical protein|nr:hypothetical protein [Acholeplasmataceae bacterium]
MSFFLFLLESVTILLARIEWINDHLTIPVFEQVETYRYLPEAKLYIDDYWIMDAEVVYERNGVEWTFISTVNTSKVKSYSIKYRATFETYNISSTHTIIFDVVDLEPPTIIHIPEHEMVIGKSLPKFLEGVVLADNYYQVEDLSIHFDLSKVMEHQIGDYYITYQVSDPSGNVRKRDVLFKIIDPIPPNITQHTPVILNILESLVWSNYLTIKDNVDQVLDVLLDDDQINYQKPGVYPLIIYATDRSNNQASEIIQVTIADLSEPTIVLRSSPPTITVYQPITRELLESYVIDLFDNYSTLSIHDVSITHDIETSFLGQYAIHYEVSDHAGNKTTKTLIVHVIDNIKPSITLLKPLIFDVFSTKPFLMDYFEYSDNYQPMDELSYKLTESVKMSVLGMYPITLEVTDKSQNKAIYQGYVTVVDREPPTIRQLNEIVITDFEPKNYTHYFEVSDQYDDASHIELSFDDHEVNYERVGIYPCYAYAKDVSLNLQTLIFEIVVIDMIEPELMLTKTAYVHQIGDEPVDLYSFIASASDNYDLLNQKDIKVLGEVSWHELGQYLITYTLEDQSKNHVEKELVITVDDDIPPTLTFDDVILYQGDPFNPYDGVFYDDNLGTPHITIVQDEFDTHEVGSYIITYIVYDKRGNYITKDRQIVINPRENRPSIEHFIPVIMVTIIGCGILYILYKKG